MTRTTLSQSFAIHFATLVAYFDLPTSALDIAVAWESWLHSVEIEDELRANLIEAGPRMRIVLDALRLVRG